MRLEIGTFPVADVRFGTRTRFDDGVLEINKDELISAIRKDTRVSTVDLQLAKPGESVRIWPVRDMIEPRVKVEGEGVAYPGICGRDITRVGSGRTHRLSGVAVAEVSEVQFHIAGGVDAITHDPVFVYIDMSGEWAKMNPYSSLQNVCVLVEPDEGLHINTKNRVVHQACLTVSDILASTTKRLIPPRSEVFDLGTVDPSLPKVVLILGLHSAQAMSGDTETFCSSLYGWTQLTPPWAFHPNEVLDGAITGPYRTMFAMSWMKANNPVLLELYRRHGADHNFVGCIALRTEWTNQLEKDLITQETGKLAWLMGAQGAIVTWDAGGNEFMEAVRTVRECEKLGIKTVFVTSEGWASAGVSSLLEPLVDADAIVSTGWTLTNQFGIEEVSPVQRVIGSAKKREGRLGETLVNTDGPLPPPQRYDDHYGYTRFRGVEY